MRIAQRLRDRAHARRMHLPRLSMQYRYALLALVLGLGVGLGGHAAFVQADSPPNGVTVSGQGSATLPPDQASVSGAVQTNASTASDALDQNSTVMRAVLAAVQTFGLSGDNVQTTTVTVYPRYSTTPTPDNGNQQPPQIVGYTATSTITVKTAKLDTLGELIQTMVNAGLNDFNGVQFSLQNPETLRTMALNAAIRDAQAEGQAAASALGVSLGAVLNFTTQSNSGGPVPFSAPAPPPAASAIRAAAPPVIQPGPLTATANVTITYAIVATH